MATPAAVPRSDQEKEIAEDVNWEEIGAEEEDDDGDDDDGDEDEEEEEGRGDPSQEIKNLDDLVSRRNSIWPARVRVNGVFVKGNARTRASLIEAEVLPAFRSAVTLGGLLRAAAAANERLRRLGIFESVSITLDAGPPDLPGTADVVIEVVEAKNAVAGDICVFSKPEARTWSLEGSLKFKNLFGYGDIWDASGAYGWDQISEISAGLSLPRFLALSTPQTARLSLLTQDWFKLSSYKEHLLGLSFGLLSTKHQDLTCNLTLRMLSDPSHISAESRRRQMLSSFKYTYKIDKRDSNLRPTCGYAFLSASQVGGLGPDSGDSRFIRQEFDLRGALPLGFHNTALNIGVAADLIMPWGSGFLDSSLPDRLYMGNHSSPVCTLGGGTSLLGYKSGGFSLLDLKRLFRSKFDNDDSNASPVRSALGGGLAVSAFADLSFDMPLELFRESGIHGHMFVCARNLSKLTGQEFKNFSFSKYIEMFRSSAGFGLIIPARLFRMEINYCYILKQSEHDQARTGVQFNFSSPL
uniref:Uncharacterized protein LOC105044706 n=1 Tax=Elaeis guineensis var. tenera TaxID=51953 RepID=A0A6I9RC77_ELAGV|nr:uncharacterized protein LOC105044706 [Elaeis guineensis]